MCRLSTYIDVYLVFVQLRLTIKLFTKLFNSHAVLLNIACTVHYCCANTTNILNRNRNWAKFPHSMRPHCTLIVKISKSNPKNSPQMNSTSLASRHYFNWSLVNWRGHSWLNFCLFHISRCPDNDNAVGAPDDARDLCAEHCQQHWFNHPFDIDWRLCVGFGQRTATHRKYLRPNRIGCRRSVVENILQSKRWRRQQLNQLSAILGVHSTLIMVVERARIEKLGKKFSINMKSLNWMRNIGQKHRNHHIEAYSNKRISLKTLQIFPLDRNEGKARANRMHLICLCAECGPTGEANLYTFISVCEAGSCPILTSFFWCCIHLPKCSLSCTTNRKRRNSIFLSLSCCDLFWTQSLRNFSHKHANEYLTKNNCEFINDCWASLSGGPTKWNIENFFWRINYWIRIYSIGYSMVRVHVGA